MSSHYSRKDAQQKRFLNPNLNIMWMYNLIYLEAVESEVLEREKDIIRARQERRPIPEKLKLAVREHTHPGEAIPVLYALLPTVPKTLWMWYLSTSCKTFPCQI
ncbi:unnamed protein product [Porites evermanni]|uniref:Uncharacterized protein n=1 Tax=Porites evermanni TaxID=104178 RepID=A0ABN8N1U0_9CNID|nr:unnamed protein product [Porites evermanni]